MSHFTVMVLGDAPEQQLAPFQENNMGNCPKKYLKFFDTEEEMLSDYNDETNTTNEFYCSSNSSNGHQITNELYLQLASERSGFRTVYKVEKSPFQYFRNNHNYKCRSKDHTQEPQWIRVLSVKETNHPDKDCCFEGVMEIQKIDPPKSIPIKDVYKTFESYAYQYCGYENRDETTNKFGYWENPNAKWDWYELGGRWSGMIKLKEDSVGIKGKPGVFGNQVGIDQVIKKDISNFDEIRTFAVIKDGKWYEKGSMGWWGIVKDGKEETQWEEEFKKLLSELPEDTLISIYDCHI